MTDNTVLVTLIVNLLDLVLPHFGVQIGSAALTTTLQTLIGLVSAVVIYIKHQNVQNELKGLKGL